MTRKALPIVLAALALLLPGAGWAKPPVWTAHGRGADIVLFGSVHILPQNADWRPDALTQALAEADQLWFEIPIDDSTQLDAAREALAKGLLPKERNLADMLSDKGKARLRREETALRLPGADLERLRPWLAELTIGEADYARTGATPDQGVERQLAKAAPQAARHAFETPAQQIAMFAGQGEAVQVKSLEDTLRDLEEDPDQSKRLIDAWLRGDMKALEKALQASGLPTTRSHDGALVVDADPTVVGLAALKAGVALTELRTAEGGLEDVFLQLTASSPQGGEAA